MSQLSRIHKLISKAVIIITSLVLISSCSEPKPVSVEMLDKFINEQVIDKNNPNWKQHLPRPPKADFAEKKKYFWDLETNKGNISIQLLPQIAPMHVSNAIYLTRLGFYDGIIFHRVIKGFMAQGGDPTGTGRGGPGYKFSGEFDESAKHSKAGILSTANSGPGTDGSQFFITFIPKPNLDNSYTVYGEVVSGMDTVRTIESFGSVGEGGPSEKIQIIKATIHIE